jgi:poly-gamma-glutamate capsule biosynthesis protein CapA/YwtB (metallophosphatase superfamily)
MDAERMIMLAVGDLIFDSPEARSLADLVKPTLAAADVVVGQLEVVFTARGANQYQEVPAPPCPPEDFEAVAAAHFNVLTLAGNHIWDSGAPGITDTIALLKQTGIVFTGAGASIEEARRPGVIERGEARIGFLAYNCVGPKDSWATPAKPGCAYLNIITHYEPSHTAPESPALAYSFVEPRGLHAMVEDIRGLRGRCDILVVYFHKGRVHTPIVLDTYEQPLCHAALDAGADLILGGHAHILKGVEIYRGRAIFHGLGNFVTVTTALTTATNWNMEQWIERRKKMFGFEPDPEYPTYAFHPEGKLQIIAKFVIENKKITEVRYIPCMVNKKGQPEVLGNDERGGEVFRYMEKITLQAGLNGHFRWDGDEVVVSE